MLSGGPLMLVVVALLGLVIAIYVISRNVKANKLAISEIKGSKEAEGEKIISESSSEEEEVAAFMALHLYLSKSRHDRESNVLTIERIQRRYSPWNAKIYSMNNILK